MPSRQYLDPTDVSTKSGIILAMKRAKTGIEILRIINSVFSTGIYDTAEKFDGSMGAFHNNWKTICKSSGVKPKDIVIVDEIVYYNKDGTQGEFSILLTAMDRLTRFGYCIRAKTDLELCNTCESVAILAKKVHVWMVEKNQRSDKYTGICSHCAGKVATISKLSRPVNNASPLD